MGLWATRKGVRVANVRQEVSGTQASAKDTWGRREPRVKLQAPVLVLKELEPTSPGSVTAPD
jgi:hypothetical protein